MQLRIDEITGVMDRVASELRKIIALAKEMRVENGGEDGVVERDSSQEHAGHYSQFDERDSLHGGIIVRCGLH